MKVLHDIYDVNPPAEGAALTIGNFDGVHLGHRGIMETLRAEALKLEIPAVAMTFDPHPLAIASPRYAPACLTTLDEKLDMLEKSNLDAVVVIRCTPDLLNIGAADFLRLLADACKPRVIVEGPTFNFGRGRSGSIETLKEHESRYGYRTIIVDELRATGLADAPEINSSWIRRAVSSGAVEDARVMLGRPYRICGVVGEGKHIGQTIGFPTANLESVRQLIPGHSVYAAVAQIDDGSFHLAAVNIGPQPTFGDDHTRIEAYVLDYEGNLRERVMGLHFLARLRDQIRFECPERLSAQLREDVHSTRSYAEAVIALADEAAPLH